MPADQGGGPHFSGTNLDVSVANIGSLNLDPNGVGNVVTTNTTQTISGVKTFGAEVVTTIAPANVKASGAKCDGQMVSDGVMNGTTAVLTSASGKFVAGDVGKLILVPGAGAAGALLTSTIASYQSATQITLAAVSQTAVAAAQVTWGTDDTAAWGTCLAATPLGSTVRYSGFSLITAALAVTKSVNIESAGFTEIWGTESQSNKTNTPGVWPFISGSAIVPCTAGQNGLNLTGTGVQVNLKNVCIRFADGIAFLNAGHGIYGVPSAMDGSGHENGPTDCRWNNVLVWGHDGNHYAFYTLNQNYVTADHIRGQGGGGLYLECDSYTSQFGNGVYINPYFNTFCGTTAHGYILKSRTTGGAGCLNLLTFIRPQSNIGTAPAALNGIGITAVNAAQHCWENTNNPPDVGIYDPDLEGATVNFGTMPSSGFASNGIVQPRIIGNITLSGATITYTSGSSSQIVPSVAGFYITNNAITQNNLSLTDAGNLSVRGSFSTAGPIGMTSSGSVNPPAGGFYVTNAAINQNNLTLTDAGNLSCRGTLGIGSRPAFVAGDKYLVADSSGNVHVSATGPAS
jgi:hypothetical protein